VIRRGTRGPIDGPIRVATLVALAALAALAALVVLAAAPAGAVDTTSPGSPQGNVTPTLQPTAGVAAVAQSAPVDGRVALVLHNGTTKPVRIDLVSGVATRTDGGLATRARTAKTYPQVLAPDQLALASITFPQQSVTPGATIAVKVRSTRVSAARAKRVLSTSDLVLSAPLTGPVAQTMGATLTNTTTAWIALQPEVAVVCFGEASTPTTFASARASMRRIAPGKTAVVSVPLSLLCPTYLVAARAS
jgi:hypothetical protein